MLIAAPIGTHYHSLTLVQLKMSSLEEKAKAERHQQKQTDGHSRAGTALKCALVIRLDKCTDNGDDQRLARGEGERESAAVREMDDNPWWLATTSTQSRLLDDLKTESERF